MQIFWNRNQILEGRGLNSWFSTFATHCWHLNFSRMMESTTFQKFGSSDFLQIANDFSKWFPQFCPLHLIRQHHLLKFFLLRTFILYPARTNLKLQNILVTTLKMGKGITALDLPGPLVVLKNCDCKIEIMIVLIL